MAALTNDQYTYWESLPQDFPLYLYIHSPATVFAAQVNQTVFSYPLMQITFDSVTTGAYTDIKEGMTVLIGTSAGLDNLGRVRVRKSAAGTVATSTVLNVSRSSRGTGDGELNLANDVYITVLDQYLIWSVPPYITDTGVIYKDGEIPFNINYAHRPKANIGGDVLKVVDVGVTEADVYFDGQYSMRFHPDATSTLTYSWDFPGCTPSTSSSATPGLVEVPLGKRHVSLTVTDSNGVTHTSRALVVVTDEDDPDLIKYWAVDSWTEGQQGQEIRIRVDQPLSYVTYPDSTDVLICTSEHEDQVGLAGREHMLFSGWLSEEVTRVEASERGLVSRLSFGLADVATRLRELPSFPDTVDRKSTPTNWMEMEGANPDRFVHYRLDWHTTALTRADFYPSGYGDNYAFTTLSSSGSDMFEDITWITGATAHLITCDIYGALWMRQDPQITPTAAQNAALSIGIERDTTSRLTLEPRQWSGYGYTHQRTPRTHFNWGEALLTSTANMSNNLTIYTAHVVAPGFSPGQGAGEDNTTQQIVKSVNELRMRVGNIYRARQNALKSNFQIDLIPMRSAIHPANMEWVTMTLNSGQSGYRGRTLTSQRVLPIAIEYDVDVSRGIRRPRLSVEVEVTDGTPATPYTPKSNDLSDWSFNIPDIDFGDFVYPIPEFYPYGWDFGLIEGGDIIYAVSDDGYLWRTDQWQTASAFGGPQNWTPVAAGVTGAVQQFVVDAFSPGYPGGGNIVGGAVNGIIVTNSGVYHMESLNSASPVATLVSTHRRTDGLHSIDSSYGTKWRAILFSAYPDGCYVRHSEDMETWSIEEPYGSGAFGLDVAHSHPGAWVSSKTAGEALTSGLESPSWEYTVDFTVESGLWVADNYGGGTPVRVDGVGWPSADGGSYRGQRLMLDSPGGFDPAITLTQMEVVWEVTDGTPYSPATGYNVAHLYFLGSGASPNNQQTPAENSPYAETIRTDTFDHDGYTGVFSVWWEEFATGAAPEIVVKSITIRGLGVNPYL